MKTWKERFDEEFGTTELDGWSADDVKTFFASELERQTKEVVEHIELVGRLASSEGLRELFTELVRHLRSRFLPPQQ